MAAIKFFVVFSCMVLASLIIGFHNLLTSVEENGCEMTYMFEYPQYVVSTQKENGNSKILRLWDVFLKI